MGRVKLEIKKIEDSARRKATHAKRRNGLLKKARELSVLCDCSVTVIAFSPSGELSQFCGNDRIEDVISRFANTPQHERTKASFENVEVNNKVVQKVTLQGALEAPRVGAADLQQEQEVQILRNSLNKTTVERNLSEQEACYFTGEERYLVDEQQPLIDEMLSGIPARESTEELNVGSSLDNASSSMAADSQMKEPVARHPVYPGSYHDDPEMGRYHDDLEFFLERSDIFST